MKGSVSVIIVNYNGGKEAVENAALVASQIGGLRSEIIVVDNASVDGSPDRLEREVAGLRVLRSAMNLGYAAGLNMGLARASGDVLVVMNTDVRPRPGAVPRLVEDVLSHPDYGLVGGRLVESDGSVNRNCFRAASRLSDVLREAFFLPPRRAVLNDGSIGVTGTEVLSGAVMALSRDTLGALGPMDERFFLYREDVEWCDRARSRGMKVGVSDLAEFEHAGGASTRRVEGLSFAARVLSDFHYFCDIAGFVPSAVRRLWTIRLRLRSLFYMFDPVLRPSRKQESLRRSAIYGVLARRVSLMEWPGGDARRPEPSELGSFPTSGRVDRNDPRPFVLLVVPDLNYGGVQRRVECLVTGPLADVYHFEVLCLRERGPIGERLLSTVPIHCVGVRGWRTPGDWFCVRSFCSLLSPDLVQSATLPADLACFFGFAGRCPWMSVKVSVDRWMRPYHRLAEWIALARASTVVANGDRTAESKSYLGRYGMLPLAIPNPPMIEIREDEPRAFPADRPILVSVLGRLEPVKRVDLFLATAAELERRDPGRYCFEVLGDGSEMERLKAETRRLGLSDLVNFAGGVGDVAGALDRADIVPLFSAGDGNPFSVQETLARGRVPIVLRAGGAADSLPAGLDCCFVEEQTAEAFADRIEAVSAEPGPYLEGVAEAREHIIDRMTHFEVAMRTAYERSLGRERGVPKVLHLITRLIVGGAQENTIASVERVARDRYDSRLWIGPQTGSEGSLLADARSRGVLVRVLPDLVREINPLKDLAVTWQLYRLMRRERFDIVHTHSSKAGIVGRLAARMAGVPHVVHTVHGWGFHEHMNPMLKKFYVALEKLMLPWTRPLVTVSHRTTRIGLEEGIGRDDSYTMIRSGIPLSRFHPDADSRRDARAALGVPDTSVVVGSVGRLSPQKNPHDFVRVAAQLLAPGRDLRFVYVGDGPLREEILRTAARAGIADRIHFLGIRDDVPDLLRAMDVFILTSLWEGLPRVVPQALATGLPVVAYDIAGIEEAVREGVNGHLVSPGAVDDMVERLAPIVDDADLRDHMSLAAVEEFDDSFSEDAMISALEVLYDGLLEE